MISTSYDKVITKEDLLRLIEYSLSLFEREKDEEQQSELEELIEVNKNESNNNGFKNLVYLDNYQQQRLFGFYSSVIGAYLDKRIEAMHDFSDRVPGKHMDKLPKSIMGGVLGFTYLGDNRVTLRDDLVGDIAKMVDIHECAHTTWEYETIVRTSWKMTKERPKYIK